MKVRQHYPASFEGFEVHTGEVHSLEELFAIPFVANFSKPPNFWRYSVTRDYAPEFDMHLLLAEYREGDEWWVVAYLTGKDSEVISDLPEPLFRTREKKS